MPKVSCQFNLETALKRSKSFRLKPNMCMPREKAAKRGCTYWTDSSLVYSLSITQYIILDLYQTEVSMFFGGSEWKAFVSGQFTIAECRPDWQAISQCLWRLPALVCSNPFKSIRWPNRSLNRFNLRNEWGKWFSENLNREKESSPNWANHHSETFECCRVTERHP